MKYVQNDLFVTEQRIKTIDVLRNKVKIIFTDQSGIILEVNDILTLANEIMVRTGRNKITDALSRGQSYLSQPVENRVTEFAYQDYIRQNYTPLREIVDAGIPPLREIPLRELTNCSLGHEQYP